MNEVENYRNHSSDVEYIDAEKIIHPLIIRNWQPSDYFFSLGMKSEKKISDFFIDEKISLSQKKTIPILISNNDIVWICGLRIDDRFKITASTKKILKLTYTKIEYV